MNLEETGEGIGAVGVVGWWPDDEGLVEALLLLRVRWAGV